MKHLVIILLIVPMLDVQLVSHRLLMETASEVEFSNEHQFSISFLKYLETNNKTHAIIPIGRFTPRNKDIKLYINSLRITTPIILKDCFGGDWVNLSLNQLKPESSVKIYILRKKGIIIDYLDNVNNTRCINPSKYIDSNHSEIINTASSLVMGSQTREVKARIFFEYIHNEIKYNDELKIENASDVLLLKSGVCRHKARLFVALCRAINIPARTISGLIASDSSPVDNLHQWAEFQNETGYWIQVDPTNNYFRIKNPLLIDYFFGWYQNPLLSGNLNLEENKTTVSINNYLASFSIESVTIANFDIKLTLEFYELGSLVCLSLFLYYFFISKEEDDILKQLRKELYPNWIQRRTKMFGKEKSM